MFVPYMCHTLAASGKVDPPGGAGQAGGYANTKRRAEMIYDQKTLLKIWFTVTVAEKMQGCR